MNEMTNQPIIQSGALAEISSSKQVAEIQARLTVAKTMPRDEAKARDRILQACSRARLASDAIYSYPRGGQAISGPSIRLAEVLARNWGNIDAGVKEISQENGRSVIEAFCWDLETNTRISKEFTVQHVRWTRSKGSTKLDDPRDQYEVVANQAARRMRACILGLIPSDIVEEAVEECERTQHASVELTPEKVRAMLDAFSTNYKVDEDMIRQRIGHNIDTITPAEFLQLKRVYKSIKDGFSKPDAYFEFPSTTDGLNKKLDKAVENRVEKAVETPVVPAKPRKPAKAPPKQATPHDNNGESFAPGLHQGTVENPVKDAEGNYVLVDGVDPESLKIPF